MRPAGDGEATARILVVEDENIVAKDLAQTLTSLGYQVCGVAASGEDAVRAAHECRPDLVLMDIRLRGDIDGIEAARRIHEEMETPVVFLTAHADQATLERAAAAEPSGYVLKPFDDHDLHVTLMVALYEHRAVQLRAAERRALEARDRTARAEAALRERDEFIALAAHELRTPLTALLLKLETLERSLERHHASSLPPGTRERIRAARDQGGRLGDLLERLLDVAALSCGDIDLRLEPTDLARVIREVIGQLREPAARAGSAIELSVDGDSHGRWDAWRIGKAVRNLLLNAIKYGAGRPIDACIDGRGADVRLIIADRGIGLDVAGRRQLFARYQRAGASINYGGLGLGLFLARRLIEAHGGRISIDSREGGGVEVTIDLPRKRLED